MSRSSILRRPAGGRTRPAEAIPLAGLSGPTPWPRPKCAWNRRRRGEREGGEPSRAPPSPRFSLLRPLFTDRVASSHLKSGIFQGCFQAVRGILIRPLQSNSKQFPIIRETLVVVFAAFPFLSLFALAFAIIFGIIPFSWNCPICRTRSGGLNMQPLPGFLPLLRIAMHPSDRERLHDGFPETRLGQCC